jgi:hypothetical protein
MGDAITVASDVKELERLRKAKKTGTIYENNNSNPPSDKSIAKNSYEGVSEQEDKKSKRWGDKRYLRSSNKLKSGKNTPIGNISILENLSDMYNTKDMDSDKSKNYFLKKSVTPPEIGETEKFYNKEKERKLRNTIF